LLGLLVPTSGFLLVDDVAITVENRRSWQDRLGYVPQDIYLTGRSVAENIAFGIEAGAIDMGKVRSCAEIAQIHDFVQLELPDGYATPIGDRGLRLSGGQRQRIGIARALYNDPAVLVLDEATNALDPTTELRVLEALDHHCSSMTRIIVAHRMSTVRSCNTIGVVDRGRLTDIGTYDQLFAGSPIFQELVFADLSPTQSTGGD
jgi:ABC-type multidrug transport system fused ATPase/permease subunit